MIYVSLVCLISALGLVLRWEIRRERAESEKEK